VVTYDHRDSRFFELPEPQKGAPFKDWIHKLAVSLVRIRFPGNLVARQQAQTSAPTTV